MNNVIHVVHAKFKKIKMTVLFTITISNPVHAIHHSCSQLESATQSPLPPSIVLRLVKYASREPVPCRMVRNWAMLQILCGQHSDFPRQSSRPWPWHHSNVQQNVTERAYLSYQCTCHRTQHNPSNTQHLS